MPSLEQLQLILDKHITVIGTLGKHKYINTVRHLIVKKSIRQRQFVKY